ncbi:MAG: efflux RND transporter periplasmic adaptor subunit [Myxococcota bacterium]
MAFKSARTLACGVIIVVIGQVMSASACSGASAQTPPPEPPPGASTRSLPASVALEVVPVSRDVSDTTVDAPGRVVWQDGALVDIGAPASGRVVAVKVAPGDRVKAGDVVAVLSSREAADARGELGRARVALDAARSLAHRQRELAEHNVGIESERAAADLQVLSAQADLARAEHSAAILPGTGDEVQVVAPMDGVVVERAAQPGMVLQASAPVVSVGDPTRLWIQVDVYEHDLAAVHEGEAAEVALEAGGLPLAAKVARVGARVDTALRRAPVYLAPTDASVALRPGMFARASIHLPKSAAGIEVPATAVIIKEGGQAVVWIEDHPQHYAPRPVMVGDARGGRVPILKGLQDGERIVARGALLLDQSGQQVL